MSAMNLENVSDEDLVAELMRRKTIISSIWNIEVDFRPLIEEDADCDDLSDDQIGEAAKILFEECSGGLEDVLGQRGNSYTSDRWYDLKEDILAKVRGSAPSLS